MSRESRLLRVFSVNMWGLRWPLGEDDIERFRTLREVLRKEDYDFVLLQEVWYRNQYDMIKGTLPYISEFTQFNPRCSGNFVVPFGCSGLVILSKHPIEFAGIRPFSVRGSFWNFDGEVFVRKGIARARSKWNGFTVDLFTSHLVSYTNNPNYDNTMYRFQQVMEVARAIRDSKADIKLFGGDLNALPYLSERQPYRILRTVSADSLTDVFDEDASFHPFFSTYGNPENSYKGTAIPERIDYLMYASAPQVKMTCVNFALPFHMGRDPETGDPMSISDHEGLFGEYLVEWRQQKRDNHNSDQEDQSTDSKESDALQLEVWQTNKKTALHQIPSPKVIVANNRNSPAPHFFTQDDAGGSGRSLHSKSLQVIETEFSDHTPNLSHFFLDSIPKHPNHHNTFSNQKPVASELPPSPPPQKYKNFSDNNLKEENTPLTDDEVIDDSDEDYTDYEKEVLLWYRTDRINSVR